MRRSEQVVYSKLRADHRALLRKIRTFEAVSDEHYARALLRHVVERLPTHAAVEEAYNVPGCNCEEHPIFHCIAVDGLRGEPVLAAAALSRMLRRHIATEEEAWAAAGR